MRRQQHPSVKRAEEEENVGLKIEDGCLCLCVCVDPGLGRDESFQESLVWLVVG